MASRDWSETDLTGDPRLLFADRKGGSKRLDVVRAEVHEDLFDDLREIAHQALEAISVRDPKPYSSFAAKTTDDYFDVDVSDIPKRRDKRKREDDPEADEIASALSMIAETDRHPALTAEDLRETTYNLHAIVFESDGDYVGFVRYRSPQRTVKPGLKYLQYGDSLKRIEPPDLAIDDDVDIVIAPDRCAVLGQRAFTTLFGDVGIAFESVPDNVSKMTEAFSSSIPLTDLAVDALLDRCGRRVSDAERLNHIVTQRAAELGRLSTDQIEELLERRGLQNAIVGGRINLEEDSVHDFLDLVEGRLFNDDVTGDERRADAYSPRTS